TFEVRVSMTCGFKSHLPHQTKSGRTYVLPLFLFWVLGKARRGSPPMKAAEREARKGTRSCVVGRYCLWHTTGSGSSAGALRPVKNTQGASSRKGSAESKNGLFSINTYSVSATRQSTSVAWRCFASRHSSSRKNAATRIAPRYPLFMGMARKALSMAWCSSPTVGRPPSQERSAPQNTLCQISNRPERKMRSEEHT